MATQYNPSPNMTANKNGWQTTASTLTVTSDGGHWQSQNVGGKPQMWIDLNFDNLNKPEIPTGNRFTLVGVQVRRNSGSGWLDHCYLQTYGKLNDNTQTLISEYVDLRGGIFPIGKWVTLPAIQNPTFTTNYFSSGAGFLRVGIESYSYTMDFTVKGFDVYKRSEAPNGAVIDDSDVDYTIAATADSLSTDFSHKDPNELITHLEWNYGDGSPTETVEADFVRERVHVYPTADTYTTKLSGGHIMYSHDGSSRWNQTHTVTKTVKVPSGIYQAAFDWQSSYLDVDVDGSPSQAASDPDAIIDTYEWDWGDGSPTGSGVIESHSYPSGAGWPLTLTIANSLGQSSEVTKTVTTEDLPTQGLNFTYAKDLLEVAFFTTVTGGAFDWSFGDGDTSTEAEPVHTYDTAGEYQVTLKYTPSGGVQETVIKTVLVREKYTPIENFTDALRLELELPPQPGQLYNEVKNPNGEQGGYGFTTPTTYGLLYGSDTSELDNDKGVNGWKLIYTNENTTGTAQEERFFTETVRMDPGQWVNASWQVPYIDGFYRAQIQFYDQNLLLLSSSTPTGYLSASGSNKSLIAPVQAPASTYYVVCGWFFYSNTSGAYPAEGAVAIVRRIMLAIAATSAELENLSYSEEVTWLNVIDDSFEIGISRTSLDVSTINAGIRNYEIDPAIADKIRPGWGVRLRTPVPDGTGYIVWQNIYRGKTENATVVYDRPEVNLLPASDAVPAGLVATNFATNPSMESATGSVEVGRNIWHNPDFLGTTSQMEAPGSGNMFIVVANSLLEMETQFSGTCWVRTGAPTATNLPVVAGTEYGFEVHWQSDFNRMVWTNVEFMSGGSVISTVDRSAEAIQEPLNSVPVVEKFSVVAPAGATHMRAIMHVGAQNTNELHYIDKLLISDSPIIGYFDGTMADDGTFQYSWAGTVNNSTSIANAIPVTGYTPVNSKQYQTNVWKASGSKSVEVVPEGSDASYVTVNGLSLVAGNVYSVTATIQTPDSFDGAGVYVRQVVLRYLDSTSTEVFASSTRGQVGEQNSVSLEEHEIPSGATGIELRLYNGGYRGGPRVRFDNLIINEGARTEFFTGDTTDTETFTYNWTGTTHASTSEKWTVLIPANTRHYELDDPNIEKKTVIVVNGYDNVTELARQGEARGLHRIFDLPYILEGKKVPYRINGSTAQVTSAQIVSENKNASLLDQITITRDTDQGYAWVDRNNVFNAYDQFSIPIDVKAIIQEDDYSEIDVNFSTDQCINEVTVKWLRYTPPSGEETEGNSEEIIYGPYVDVVSQREWGRHPQEFVIHGIVEDPAAIQTFANNVLTKNATPVTKVHSLAMPIIHMEDLSRSKVTLDLYDLVNVRYVGSSIDERLRISEIEHQISVDRWDMALGFTVDGAVATPTAVPSPPVSGVVGSGGGGGTVDIGAFGSRYVTNNWTTNGATTPLPLDASVEMSGVGYDSATKEFVIQKAGVYNCIMQANVDANTYTGYLTGHWTVNGTQKASLRVVLGSWASVNLARSFRLNVGDRIQPQVFKNNTIGWRGGENETWATVSYAGQGGLPPEGALRYAKLVPTMAGVNLHDVEVWESSANTIFLNITMDVDSVKNPRVDTGMRVPTWAMPSGNIITASPYATGPNGGTYRYFIARADAPIPGMIEMECDGEGPYETAQAFWYRPPTI